MGENRLIHEFGPFFDEESRVLILGSFPSVKSREQQFYYGHPQNRFWKLMMLIYEGRAIAASDGAASADAAAVKTETVQSADVQSATMRLTAPQTKEEKEAFARKHHIALWDVIESCEIEGSADSSIRNAKTNDLGMIIPNTKIDRILVNGGAAWKLFEKHMLSQAVELGIDSENCRKMPSTSPANAAWTLPRLLEVWGRELKELSE